MARRDSHIYICLFISLFLLAACRTAKTEKSNLEISNMVMEVSNFQATAPVCDNLSAKLKIKAQIGEKSLSSSGTFGVEKEQGIQICINALGLFEVARLEVTPKDALVMNRVGKEYVQLDYTSASVLEQAGLNYNILQSVFLNEPFSPDGKDFIDALPNMSFTREGDDILVKTPEVGLMQYTFRFNAHTGELLATNGVYEKKVRVSCNYSDFEKLEGRSFPRNIILSIDGVGTPLALTLKLSNLKVGRYVFKNSNVASYKKMELSNIIRSLAE